MRAYLTAKLMWEPDMTDEEFDRHIDEFLKGYYGSAWEDIRSYYDFATESVEKRGECLHSMGGYPERLFVMKDYVLNEEELEALLTVRLQLAQRQERKSRRTTSDICDWVINLSSLRVIILRIMNLAAKRYRPNIRPSPRLCLTLCRLLNPIQV